MARDENLPFVLGTTYFGGDTTVIDANVGKQHERQIRLDRKSVV